MKPKENQLIQKKTIFISSRMDELADERRIAYNACHDKGLCPLMFETEPIEELKNTLNKMVDRSEFFLGVYFATIGTHNRELEDLTPIEYELARFIANQCPTRGCCTGKKQREGAKFPDCCLKDVRRYLTLHNEDLFCPRNATTSQGAKNKSDRKGNPGLPEIPPPCDRAISLSKGKIFLYYKGFTSEQAMSVHLSTLLLGTQLLGFHHHDFLTKWELYTIIARDFRFSSKKNTLAKPSEDFFYLHFKGEDYPGQLHVLAEAAFNLGLNIVNLIQRNFRRDNKAEILFSFRPYHPSVTNGSNPEAYKELFRGAIESVQKIEEKNQTEKSAEIFSLMIAGLIKRSKVHTPAYITEQKINVLFKSKERTKGFLYVRVYHLDVPGILARITRILSGWNKDVFPYVLNIEQCRMTSFDDGIPVFKKSDQDNVKKVMSIRNKFLQYTEILLSSKDPSILKILKGAGTKKNHPSEILCTLDNALRSIIGVEHVMISDDLLKQKKLPLASSG
ncbi:MAG: DUF4062 domain-containing protein [Myxococcales bacterium]|nr:MAG: DUF4062 domain-containing protein [Myxococcales bacterium]